MTSGGWTSGTPSAQTTHRGLLPPRLHWRAGEIRDIKVSTEYVSSTQ